MYRWDPYPRNLRHSKSTWSNCLEPWESHLLESLVWNTQAGVTAQDVATLIATEKFRVASDGAADPPLLAEGLLWLAVD
jgi:hypothetical protein